MNEKARVEGYYYDDHRIFKPGMCWFQPWYHDPLGISPPNGHVMFPTREDDKHNFLSVHYWDLHGWKRPPICVVLPNGEQWEVDRKSSNGTGWIVRGELPNLAVTPSIAAKGYHGYLGSNGAEPGCFTPDVEGRGPNGVWPSEYGPWDPPLQRP